MSAPALRNLLAPVAVVAALIFVYWSVLLKLGLDFWYDENYSHGLLVPFIIGYIVWADRARIHNTTSEPMPWWGGIAVLFALLSLWVGTAGAELFIQRVSLVVAVVGVLVYFFGFRILRAVVVPLALLILAIPIPSIIFNRIALPLQLFASGFAVWIMRIVGLPVLQRGNVIELMPRGSTQTRALEVVEACSGIRSLMTLVTLAVLFAYFTYPDRGSDEPGPKGLRSRLKSYGLWRTVLIIFAAIPIAVLVNALRVSGTGVAYHFYGTKAADGFFHYFSGWAFYILEFIILFGFGWALDRLVNLFRLGRGASESFPASLDKDSVHAEPISKSGENATAPVDAIPVKRTE